MAEQVNNQNTSPASPAKKMMQQRPHQRRRPKSRFGTQMQEKQALKDAYGIREQQLKRYYQEAQKSDEATGTVMVVLLERRLDNAVFRAGWAPTRKAARQLASHKLLQVNGRTVSVPSIRLRSGDVVSVKEGKKEKGVFENFEMKTQNARTPAWIALEKSAYSFKIVGNPSAEDAQLGVDIRAVVEYYAR